MNWLDIVIIILLAVSLFSGLKTGLIRSLLSLVGLLVGIKLAGQNYQTVGEKLTFISDTKAAGIVAFLLILAAVMLAALILGWVFTRIVSAMTLGWVNGLGGAVLGLVMGAITIGALLALWVRFFGTSQVISDSGLARFLGTQFSAALALLPSEFDVIRNFLQ